MIKGKGFLGSPSHLFDITRIEPSEVHRISEPSEVHAIDSLLLNRIEVNKVLVKVKFKVCFLNFIWLRKHKFKVPFLLHQIVEKWWLVYIRFLISKNITIFSNGKFEAANEKENNREIQSQRSFNIYTYIFTIRLIKSSGLFWLTQAFAKMHA